MAAVALLFTACDEESQIPNQEEQQIDMSDFYVYTNSDEGLVGKNENNKGNNRKSCYAMENLNRQLKQNLGLEKKMYDIEHHTRKFLAAKGKPPKDGGGGPGGSGSDDVDVDPIQDNLGIIDIPVYVHVVYNTALENISNTQIQSQIDVLNADFRDTNTNLLPSGTTFANDATDAGFHFTLAGITRTQNSRTSWGREDMKYASSGGHDAVTPETHLNIWVVNKIIISGRNILGYAQFPGGAAETDGVVIAHNFFGDTGVVSAPYNGGRTATHEVGHYLNLRHIWGDGRCRQDDFVVDTPASDGSNFGCPSYPTVNCKSADMTMNYMDYTNDACMYIFTDGQRNRMRALFQSGGARASMVGN